MSDTTRQTPPTHIDVALKYGLLSAVLAVLPHLVTWQAGWVFSHPMAAGAGLLVLSIVSGVWVFVLALRVVLKRDGELPFFRAFFYCLLVSFAAGMAASAYDIVIYKMIDPMLDLKTIEAWADAWQAFIARMGVPKEQVKDQTERLAFTLNELRKSLPYDVTTIIVNRIGNYNMYAGLLGLGVSFFMRTRTA